jgi:cytosine/adenosine deaminase-related metal-dependent hydrolase
VILKAAWVVPVTSPPIRSGFVRISGDRIVGVGAAAALASTVDDLVDLGDVILTPGLVNPHAHLELTCYAGALEPAPFWQWIQQLIALRAQPGQLEREGAAVAEGAWQSLRAGVTCVGDISRRNLAWPVLKSLPIRKVCFVELLTLADHPPRNPDELRAGVQAVIEDELLTVGVTPHAPYSVPADQIRATIALATEIRRPWTIHLAETPEEVAFLRGEKGAFAPMIERLLEQCGVTSPLCSPIDLLADCGRGLRRGSLAHANYVTEDEFGRLAETGHSVIYCPRSHRFFGHVPHPFVRMHAAGVPVTFGTDSLASNESLAMLDELKHVLLHVPDSPAPGELLCMTTLAAARALDLDREIGSLEPGKQADLATFPCAPEATDPVRSLIETSPPAQAVWVAGQRVI